MRFLCISRCARGCSLKCCGGVRDALSNCSSQVSPARPMAAPARGSSLAGAALLLTVSLSTLFLSRNSAEKFLGFTQQIFRALDNDDKLKSKHARSGLPLRALVALFPAETALARSVRRARKRSQAARQHALKQVRVETNGDGVKPGSTLAGHGGANVQLGRVRPRMNIFTPSPFVSELYTNSCNTLSKCAACSS